MNKLKNITSIIVIAFLMVISQSCKTNKEANKKNIEEKTDALFTKGTIVKMELDGCTWMIKLEDGKQLEPVNLEDEFKVENLKVKFQYKHHDGFSICMAGEMVNITVIEKIK